MIDFELSPSHLALKDSVEKSAENPERGHKDVEKHVVKNASVEFELTISHNKRKVENNHCQSQGGHYNDREDPSVEKVPVETWEGEVVSEADGSITFDRVAARFKGVSTNTSDENKAREDGEESDREDKHADVAIFSIEEKFFVI